MLGSKAGAHLVSSDSDGSGFKASQAGPAWLCS
jgi:hypothetical protein